MVGNLKRTDSLRFLVIGALLLFCTLMQYYFYFVLHVQIVYTHLFYIPIILAAVWWGLGGALSVSLFLALLQAGSLFYRAELGVLIRAVMLLLVGSAIGILSNRQKKMQEELQKSEEEYRTITETTPDGIYQLDESGRFIFVNESLINLLGYEREELLGKQYDFVLNPEDRSMAEKVTKEILSGKDVRAEIAVRRKDGKKLIIAYSATPLKIGREIVGITGILRDITDRKKAEEALKLSEARLSYGQQIARLGFWDWDLVTGDLYWSDETYRILGFQPQEFVPTFEKFRTIVHPEDLNSTQEHMDAAIKDGAGKSFDFRVVRPDGETAWVHLQGEVSCDAKGKPIRFAGIQIDISERKKAERALQESEGRFRQVAENAQEWIWEVDADGLYVYASPMVEKILGFKPEEVVKRKHFYDFFHPEDRERVKKAALAVFANKESFREFLNRNVHKDGRTVWLSTSGVPLVDEKGDLLGYRGLDADITEYKKAEEMLKKSKEQLEDAVERKTKELVRKEKELQDNKRLSEIGMLASIVAHELRNPLAVIKAAAYNIKRKSKDSSFDSHLANIEKKILESEQIMKNLLGFSRIKMPKLEEVSCREILDECLDSTKQKYQDWDVRTKVRCNCNGYCFLMADRLQVFELCLNIIDNAHQAFPDKQGTMEINVNLDRKKNKCNMIFKDNGVGIEKEDLARVFEPFYTNRTKGIGLGLTLCKQVVDLHGGTIDITSKKGEGTAVSVSLPIRR